MVKKLQAPMKATGPLASPLSWETLADMDFNFHRIKYVLNVLQQYYHARNLFMGLAASVTISYGAL